jgi:hypothetical protein
VAIDPGVPASAPQDEQCRAGVCQQFAQASTNGRRDGAGAEEGSQQGVVERVDLYAFLGLVDQHGLAPGKRVGEPALGQFAGEFGALEEVALRHDVKGNPFGAQETSLHWSARPKGPGIRPSFGAIVERSASPGTGH